MMNRIEINKMVRTIIEARKKQKRIIEKDIIKPIQDVIKLGQHVILGQKSMQQFIHQNEKLIEHLKGVFKTEEK